MIKEIARRGRSVVWKDEPLTFKALEQGTFQFTNDVEYSINKGEWTSLAANTATPTMRKGDTIRWRATITPTSSAGVGTFSSTCNYNAMGNPLSLRRGDSFKSITTCDTALFLKLFYEDTHLLSCKNIVLVCPTLAYMCYKQMFYGCTSLTTPMDVLPATKVSSSSYESFFEGCTSLANVPKIEASEFLNDSREGFFKMFKGCTSIRDARTLTLSVQKQPYGNTYKNMFEGCTSLVYPPSFNVDVFDFQECFLNCTSLVTTPDFSKMSILGSNGWGLLRTFKGCTSLENVLLPEISSLYSNFLSETFYGCTSLKKAPIITAATIPGEGMVRTFYNCSSLEYVKCLAVDTSAYYSTGSFMYGVKATGVFVKNPEKTDWNRNANGIPTGWTILEGVQITVTYTGGNSGAYLKEIGGSEIIHTFIDGEPYEADLDDNKSYGVYDSGNNLIQTLATPFSRTVSITI